MFSAVLFRISRLNSSLERANLCEKRGQKRVRISDPFLGPFSIGTLSTGPKNGPISGSEFWEAGYRHDLTLELAFWSRKIWARIKNQCQMQSDNPDVASSSICSTAAKKQVHACCMYTLILTRCSNCGGPLCTTTFSKGLFGLVNEPAQPSKIEDHSIETTSTEAALCSNYCLLRMRAQ